jgi:hypothetical protein
MNSLAELTLAGKVAAATGTVLLCENGFARIDRGAGLPSPRRLPYFPQDAVAALSQFKMLVTVGTRRPVAMFGYRCDATTTESRQPHVSPSSHARLTKMDMKQTIWKPNGMSSKTTAVKQCDMVIYGLLDMRHNLILGRTTLAALAYIMTALIISDSAVFKNPPPRGILAVQVPLFSITTQVVCRSRPQERPQSAHSAVGRRCMGIGRCGSSSSAGAVGLRDGGTAVCEAPRQLRRRLPATFTPSAPFTRSPPLSRLSPPSLVLRVAGP